MSRIRSRDTGLELRLRRALWAAGLRYRLAARNLPVQPDVVFPGAKVAVFCDSSFWHGRDPARIERIKTNQPYWRARIAKNVARDRFANASLHELGWLVLRFWDEELTSNLD
ncbi:MAG: very short patch repair endonuclease, partial [Dehalococcoidia bacterium]|nr:very short patch repair endonuclease [Dehalococcoidia bacterium]